MPTRKKLIVYLINNDGFDSTCAVLAEQRENGFILVMGHQLYVVADPESRQFINKEACYYIHSTYYQVKCYDCFTLGRWWWERYSYCLKPGYILRAVKYGTYSEPMFEVAELLKAGVPEALLEYYKHKQEGLVGIDKITLNKL